MIEIRPGSRCTSVRLAVPDQPVWPEVGHSKFENILLSARASLETVGYHGLQTAIGPSMSLASDTVSARALTASHSNGPSVSPTHTMIKPIGRSIWAHWRSNEIFSRAVSGPGATTNRFAQAVRGIDDPEIGLVCGGDAGVQPNLRPSGALTVLGFRTRDDHDQLLARDFEHQARPQLMGGG